MACCRFQNPRIPRIKISPQKLRFFLRKANSNFLHDLGIILSFRPGVIFIHISAFQHSLGSFYAERNILAGSERFTTKTQSTEGSLEEKEKIFGDEMQTASDRYFEGSEPRKQSVRPRLCFALFSWCCGVIAGCRDHLQRQQPKQQWNIFRQDLRRSWGIKVLLQLIPVKEAYICWMFYDEWAGKGREEKEEENKVMMRGTGFDVSHTWNILAL